MKFRILSATAVAALGVSGQLSAFADAPDAEDSRRLEVVTVTTQKTEQSLIDVPINISVTDQDLIDKLGGDDIEDLANFIPGLQVQAQSLNAPTYSLRGVVADGGAPRVAIFQNGVSIGTPGYATSIAIYDVERVEVVKGPQATLFGQGALIGGINYIQNRASTEGNEGKVTVEGGDYSFLRGEGFYNFALSDTLAVRVAGQIKNMDGYVPNTANSPDLMGQDTTAVRGAIHWEPTPAVTADVFVNYQEDDSTGTQFTSGFFPVNGVVDPYGPTAMNINADQVRSKLGNDREILAGTANLEFVLNDAWTLTSLTDYRELSSNEAWDSDGAAFNLLQFYQTREGDALSQELRVNYDNGGKLTGFFGANYFDYETRDTLTFSTDEAYAQSLFGPQVAASVGGMANARRILALAGAPGAANFGSFETPFQYSVAQILAQYGAQAANNIAEADMVFGPFLALNPAHAERSRTSDGRTSYDLFGDITYDLTDRLTLTGGLRYTINELSASNTGEVLRGNPALGGALNGVTFAPGFLINAATIGNPVNASAEPDGAFTWRLNAAYRVSDNVNTWVSYGRGRRPETLSISGRNVSEIDAETLDNVEAGMFGRFFDDRLQMTTSVYYGQYENFQTSRFDPINGVFIVENSGNATQYGLEFDGQALVTDNIRLLGTYAYNFSEYDDEDSNGNPLQFAGNRFRMSPEQSFSLAADITLPFAEHGTFSLTPSYIWKGQQYFEDDNGYDYAADGNGGFVRRRETYPDGTPVVEETGAYGLVNLRAGFDSADERWGVYVLGENLLDEEYLIDVGNTGGAFGLHTIIRGKPQMLKAGAYVKF
ncbi:TonB-dependent receptor [Hyphomonas neptunium ATCC 15444]|uniref:TonB-dependent receptor n=2 Tax=Hyphomonas TaxID=85 RepID=Q0BZJ0_HYPNA|nr:MULTISPECIES: TonB-dependent receptor [Hyphomonas]ABI75605.1 TonB-dependent receptor [Hyphomonas neptunium ATCC 15444]KCZ95192.1 TonB-dependent receptor [Hyphomonas hirschiana VP5]